MRKLTFAQIHLVRTEVHVPQFKEDTNVCAMKASTAKTVNILAMLAIPIRVRTVDTVEHRKWATYVIVHLVYQASIVKLIQ